MEDLVKLKNINQFVFAVRLDHIMKNMILIFAKQEMFGLNQLARKSFVNIVTTDQQNLFKINGDNLKIVLP